MNQVKIDFMKSETVYGYMRSYTTTIQAKVAAKYGLTIPQLYWADFYKYGDEFIDGLAYETFNTPNKYLNEQLAGMLTVGETAQIVINENMASEKQHVTFLHELIHLLKHAEHGKTQEFHEILTNGSYSFDDTVKEAEATLGAGFLAFPSIAIYHACVNHLEWDYVAKALEIDDDFMKMRLVNFLIFENSLSREQAETVVNAVEHKNLKELKGFVSEWWSTYMNDDLASEKYQSLSINEVINDYWE